MTQRIPLVVDDNGDIVEHSSDATIVKSLAIGIPPDGPRPEIKRATSYVPPTADEPNGTIQINQAPEQGELFLKSQQSSDGWSRIVTSRSRRNSFLFMGA